MALQIVTAAIADSKLRTHTAHIDSIDIARAGLTADDVCDELVCECEGDVILEGRHEFWGVDCNGVEWSVSVEVSS